MSANNTIMLIVMPKDAISQDAQQEAARDRDADETGRADAEGCR